MDKKKYYSIPYVSNSTLTWFKVSPKYCWKRMNLEIVDAEKAYTFLGTQIHLSLLEPEEFEKCYTYLDFKTPTSKQQQQFCEDYIKMLDAQQEHSDALIEAYKLNYVTPKTDASILKTAENIFEQNSEYIKYLQVKGDYREVLSKSRKELLTTIEQSIKSHKKANSLIFQNEYDILNEFLSTEKENTETFNEYPIIWEYPIEYNKEYLKCKSLIDRLVVDHKNKKITIVDLKTTGTLGITKEHIQEWNYYRQLAFYRLAVQHCQLFPKDYEIEAYIVSVTTQDPFECYVYKLSEIEYQKQLLEINQLMKDISWHWFTNQWEHTHTYYEGDGTENLIDE